jgi:glycosyltransferase involved in cell wall biosynthesis
MRRLLVIGDAACPSGFAKSTHAVCDVLDYRANPANPAPWDVTVLGINYRGDPHRFAYPIWAAPVEGDGFGVLRTVFMCDTVKPDLILIQQDPWNFPAYRDVLKGSEWGTLPVVGFVAVDGLNCRGTCLNDLAHAVFYTEFGRKAAILGGYTGTSSVVPLGVDLDIYSPGDRVAARRRRGLPSALDTAYIVGNINRNQLRKRLDLTIRYFAAWWHAAGSPDDAYLWFHVAPTGENAFDLSQLAKYYGIYDQLIVAHPRLWYGETEATMADSYRSFNVQVTTTQGEGDGLTTKEGMACGIPQIVPAWAALGEWATAGAVPVPCPTTSATTGGINAIGGIADEDQFVLALQELAVDPARRLRLGLAGRALMEQPQYRWPAVGAGVAAALETVWKGVTHGESDDEGRAGDGRQAPEDRYAIPG